MRSEDKIYTRTRWRDILSQPTVFCKFEQQLRSPCLADPSISFSTFTPDSSEPVERAVPRIVMPDDRLQEERVDDQMHEHHVEKVP